MDKATTTLSKLNKKIKNILQDNFFENVWIIAEIGEIKFNRNGHAYLELIEKDETSDKIIAKANANIWSYTLRMLKPYFETSTGQELQSGLKILVAVSIEFHELYGYSLNIRDIDPTYTLGDIERRRLEIIKQLEDDGIIEMNKELELPTACQKVAIISSATAAGYEDFSKQLKNNSYGFVFHTKLFPAVMQGENTESSIINALEHIYTYEDFFDAVVIIRGGGSRSDLLCFDNYNLAFNITQFPLPIISGIGHEKDISIVDMVAHTSLKTPTAVAEFLIANLSEFENHIDNSLSEIIELAKDRIGEENDKITFLSNHLVPLLQNRINKENKKLDLTGQKINYISKSHLTEKRNILSKKEGELITKCKSQLKGCNKDIKQLIDKLNYRINNLINTQEKKLEYFQKTAMHLDPESVLKKGYSITKHNGEIIRTANNLRKGDEIETILYKGVIKSKLHL